MPASSGPRHATTDLALTAASLLDGGIYSIAALSRYPELLHGISTRTAPDGVDWNLSARRGTPGNPPSAESALANREKLARLLGVPLGRIVGCQQIHGTEVVAVTERDAGRGMLPGLPSVQGADGMVTDVPGLYLFALSADCPPVFLYDPKRRATGLVHSGWKGTVGRIAGRAVQALSAHYGSRPSDIIAVVGPGIGPCCYEVGQNVIDAAVASFPDAWDPEDPLLQERGGATYFSLPSAIRCALLDEGLLPGNIRTEEVCTANSLDIFYSHRGEAGQCGLFGAVLGLRKGSGVVDQGKLAMKLDC